MSHGYLTIFVAATAAVVSNCYVGPSQPTARALDLEIVYRKEASQSVIRLTTGVYRYSVESAKMTTVVDLYSMVHIADPSYFKKIKESMEGYDVVLYELITDSKNCDVIPEANFKRQLNTEITAAETEKLATQYKLESQINLYNSIKSNRGAKVRNNWFIADLDATEVVRLEMPRKHITNASFRKSRFGGRAWEERLLKKFFLSDIALITALRYLSWLGPSPEFSCLLLDWSRWNQPTKAGGLPAVLLPIIEHITKGNLFAAKKLAFAQQLISGVPDSGAWGGEALSDTEVRVKARNSECCRVLKCFVDEQNDIVLKKLAANTAKSISTSSDKSGEGDESASIGKEKHEMKVAILYGAYHIGDLGSKLKTMGYKFQTASSLTAWIMEYPTQEHSDALIESEGSKLKMKKENEIDSSDIEKGFLDSLLFSTSNILSAIKNPALIMAIAGICSAYLVIGALDWWLLIDFVVEVSKSVIGNVATATSTSASALVSTSDSPFSGFLMRLVEGDNVSALNGETKSLEISLAVLYIVTYVQRHLWALRTASSVGVQWDRGLFDDSLSMSENNANR